jgi:phage baseplate assembly protein V
VNTAELTRRINNLIAIGTVTESKSADGLSLARVKILSRVTDFLPMIQMASSFKRHAVPIRPGEQVVVFQPYGNGDGGVILGSLFNKGAKEPNGYSDTKEVMEFEDGTRISYDTSSKVLEIDAVESVNVTCKNANITGDVALTGNLSVDGTISSTGDISTDANVNDLKGNLSAFSTTDGASRA